MINQFAYYKPTCELIDTLWNVNLICAIRAKRLLFELIDTLWNVNFVLNKGKHTWKEELIDTLWNVNFCQIPLPQPRWRINRYIMECKFLYQKDTRFYIAN